MSVVPDPSESHNRRILCYNTFQLLNQCRALLRRRVLRRHRKVLPQMFFGGVQMKMCYVDEFERDGKKLGGIHVLGGGETRLNPLLMFGDSAPVQS